MSNWSPRSENRENRKESLFEEIVAKTFPELKNISICRKHMNTT